MHEVEGMRTVAKEDWGWWSGERGTLTGPFGEMTPLPRGTNPTGMGQQKPGGLRSGLGSGGAGFPFFTL